MRLGLVISCFFVLYLGWVSCSDIERPLDKKTKNLIDTIVAHHIDSIRPKLDSLCLARYDSLYGKAFDSIMQIRLEQKRELMQYDTN